MRCTRRSLLAHLTRSLICLVILAAHTLPAGDSVIRTTGELQQAIDKGLPDVSFDLSVTVSQASPIMTSFYIMDESGGININMPSNKPPENLCAGMRIRVRGKTIRTFENRSRAICWDIDVLSRGTPPEFPEVTAEDLWKDRHLFRPVSLSGRVIYAFRDEISPSWVYLILNCKGETAYAAAYSPASQTGSLQNLIESQVRVKGICASQKYSNRRQVVRLVKTAGMDAVQVLQAPPSDPFDVPPLSEISSLRPEEIQRLGRHCVSGRVLATWGTSDILLKAADSEIIRAELLPGPRPKPDACIDLVGLPSVSGMRISLSKALWRPTSVPEPPTVDSAAPHTLADLLRDSDRRPCIDVNCYGMTVIVQGRIQSFGAGDAGPCAFLESDGLTISVEPGAGNEFPSELSSGCDVKLTGIFVVEADGWKSNHLLPRIDRAKIVLRSANDIQITSFPSWWTPARLIGAIGLMGVVLLVVLGWNIALQRLVERRGRALAAESIARAETDMKVLERTRLAVELHDSVAQSLTAIDMELETAGRYKTGARPELCSHLATAEKTLRSCRNDLRNCLWDLRNQALEEPDMVAAIRKTLLPHVRDVELSVRFACPREKLTDNTTHTILRIIRELVVNAISHGHASAVKIAGSIEGNDLLFSVRDNGGGFDPEAAPGVLQGHFGLQGIRERLRPHKGSLRIVSAPGATTRVIVRIPIPTVKA